MHAIVTVPSECSAMVLQGGCACRQVRYTVDGESPPSHFCHCRMCQLATGSPVAAFFTVPQVIIKPTPQYSSPCSLGVQARIKLGILQTQVHFEGKLGTYQSSKTAVRKFCTECGTPLVYQLQGNTANKGMLKQEVTLPPCMFKLQRLYAYHCLGLDLV